MSAVSPNGAAGTGGAPRRPALLFARLFFGLRGAGIPVGLSEWMGLMEALAKGTIRPDLTDFYHVARALLVKDEALFDTWDQVFAAVFAEGTLPVKAAEDLLEWLKDALPPPALTPDEWAALEQLPLEELRKRFEERLREQTERHDGGDRWIGTGGRSPYGHSGRNPAGVRVGGPGGGRSAVQVWESRRFRDYRNDRVLDTRALAVALKKLRRLERREGAPELAIDETIDETSRDAGELHLVFHPPRRNQARVLLLMDVGGSMTPWAHLVEALFSAASGLNHWRKLEALHFHNCPYDVLYEKMWSGETIPTADVLRDRPKETFLILVGDASMAPSELTDRWGAIDYSYRNETAGLVWLHRLRTQFERAVWLNPQPETWWTAWSTKVIRRLYPMFPLTVQGLEEAIDVLIKHRPAPPPPLEEGLLRG